MGRGKNPVSDDDQQFMREAIKETVRACFAHNALPVVTVIVNANDDDPPVVIDHANVGDDVLRKLLATLAISKNVT